jgi:hypothetical protein
MAARENIHIIAGQAESAGGRLHNTAVLAGHEGLIVAMKAICPASRVITSRRQPRRR